MMQLISCVMCWLILLLIILYILIDEGSCPVLLEGFIFLFSFLVCLTVIYGILNLDYGLVMCWFAMFDNFLKEVIMLFSYIMCLGGVSVLVFAISFTFSFKSHTDVRCMGLWLECFPYLQGCLQVSEKYLVAGITLNQLKGRQMVIYMVWMVGYRS